MLDPKQYTCLKNKIGKYFFNTGHKAKATSTQMMLILAELLVMTLRWTVERQSTKDERKP